MLDINITHFKQLQIYRLQLEILTKIIQEKWVLFMTISMMVRIIPFMQLSGTIRITALQYRT